MSTNQPNMIRSGEGSGTSQGSISGEANETTCVTVEHDDSVCILTIDNPPLNVSSREVRRRLLSVIESASVDPAVSALVIVGAGKTFIAGSDLREFGKPIGEPQLPDVIAALEACSKPVVAALHGAALGGGLELALGCDARVALAGTQVGFPEVGLGIIPGAGGTQRLARLTGIPRAIELICTARRIDAEAAMALGIVDKVVGAELLAEAVLLARSMRDKRRLRDRPVPDCDEAILAEARSNALRTGKNRPAVRAAVEVIAASRCAPVDEGLAIERAAFNSLRTSREARALRHIFFAERQAGKYPPIEGVSARPVSTVAVVGAGTMGATIAIAALDAGFNVTLIDRDPEAVARGVGRITGHYASRVSAGKINEASKNAREQRLASGVEWSLLKQADLVIEAVFEDLDTKREVFRQIDAHTRPGAVLASNTSYIDLDAIAAVTTRPGDVIGLHFFSPAHVMKLLEVVRGALTHPDVLATGLQLARRLQKVSVISSNSFGFIGNRIYAAYRRQCEFMLEEGATVVQIDRALEKFGFSMGPFRVADMSGLDIAWRMRKSLAASRNPHDRYVQIPDLLCEAGRLGQKTGAGYYLYENAGSAPVPDPIVDQIVAQARAAKGISPRVFDDGEISQRALLAMLNEACCLMTEGVALRPSDIDVAMVNGYGFPRWEGGPVFWGQDRGPEKLRGEMDWLAALSGHGFKSGDLQRLFDVDSSGE